MLLLLQGYTTALEILRKGKLRHGIKPDSFSSDYFVKYLNHSVED